MNFPRDISKEEVNELPLRGYQGPIVVVDTYKGLQQAIRNLSRFEIIGFDTETKPAFRKGVYHKVALLQLATEEQVYLVRLNKLGFPKILCDLFSNPSILKVGVSIRDDLIELKKLAKFHSQGVVELNEVAKELEVVREGARNLTATFLGFRISKSQQTSNWEKDELTTKQKVYAATDAWICFRIYQKLTQQGYLD